MRKSSRRWPEPPNPPFRVCLYFEDLFNKWYKKCWVRYSGLFLVPFVTSVNDVRSANVEWNKSHWLCRNSDLSPFQYVYSVVSWLTNIWPIQRGVVIKLGFWHHLPETCEILPKLISIHSNPCLLLIAVGLWRQYHTKFEADFFKSSDVHLKKKKKGFWCPTSCEPVCVTGTENHHSHKTNFLEVQITRNDFLNTIFHMKTLKWNWSLSDCGLSVLL